MCIEVIVHLVGVIDGDLEASENLPCWRVLVHDDLKLVLRTVLAVEGGRMVVEVDYTDRDCRNVVVQQLVVQSDFSCLGLNH